MPDAAVSEAEVDSALSEAISVDADAAEVDPWGPECKPRHWVKGVNKANEYMPPPYGVDTLSVLLPDGRVVLGHGAALYQPKDDTYDFIGGHPWYRIRNSATVLADGKTVLYIGGGWGDGSSPSNSAELFDVTTKTMRRAAPMRAARVWPKSFLLPNGKVLVVGGNDYVYEPRPSAEIYDPATNSWTDSWRTMKHEGHQQATQLADGSVFALYGDPTAGNHPYVYRYHPSTDVWEELPEPPLERQYVAYNAIALPDGRVMITDGYKADIYDPTTRTWKVGSNPGLLVNAHPRPNRKAIVLPCGKVLVFGHAEFERGPTPQHLYDPKLDQWLEVSRNPPRGIENTATGLLLPDGRVLVTYGLLEEGIGLFNKPLFFVED